jgi:fructosamine-3-kinase
MLLHAGLYERGQLPESIRINAFWCELRDFFSHRRVQYKSQSLQWKCGSVEQLSHTVLHVNVQQQDSSEIDAAKPFTYLMHCDLHCCSDGPLHC